MASHENHDAGLRLLRGVLLVDGTTICSFRRRAHETLSVVLERSGHVYTLVQPDGAHTRHLVPTARSSHRALVLATLELRNRCAWHCHGSAELLPYVHCALQQQSAPPLRRMVAGSSRSLRARWPTGNLSAAKLFDPATQRFEVRSIEGNACVRLHASGLLVGVAYTVWATRTEEDAPSDDNSHVATVRQSFTVGCVPPCFAYPVALLQHARSASLDANDTGALCLDASVVDSSLVPSQLLPTSAADSARPTFTALSAAAADATDATLALEDVLRVARRLTKALSARAAAETTPDATFFVCRGDPPSVVIEVARDAAVIECTGSGFFRWFDSSGQLQQQFTAETIPPTTFSCVSISVLCSHAMELLRAQSGQQRAAKVPTPPQATSDAHTAHTAMVETAETALGRFRAFADGRVRVVFSDRTILQVDSKRVHCVFFFATGATGESTVASAPPAQQLYIRAALEFADWAFASPHERLQRHEQRQLREDVAAQELRRIGVRCHLNNQQREKTATSTSSLREDDGTNDVPHYVTPPPARSQLPLERIRQLQEATQQHIASVHALLHTSSAPAYPLQ